MFLWYLQFSWRDLWSFSFYCFPLLLCIVHLRKPSYLSLNILWNSVGYIFPFLPCFLLIFFPWLFVKLPQKTTLSSCVSFSLGWFWSLPSVQCCKPPSIVLQALCLPQLFPWSYSSLPLCNHKGFDLGHTWTAYWFPYFLQFKPEFCVKELIIWAIVSSRSYFFWLYRASPSLAAKNIINLISVLTI